MQRAAAVVTQLGLVLEADGHPLGMGAARMAAGSFLNEDEDEPVLVNALCWGNVWRSPTCSGSRNRLH